MGIALNIVAISMILGGIFAIATGLPVIQLEMGWSSVIAGAAFASAGFISVVLLQILRRMQDITKRLDFWANLAVPGAVASITADIATPVSKSAPVSSPESASVMENAEPASFSGEAAVAAALENLSLNDVSIGELASPEQPQKPIDKSAPDRNDSPNALSSEINSANNVMPLSQKPVSISTIAGRIEPLLPKETENESDKKFWSRANPAPKESSDMPVLPKWLRPLTLDTMPDTAPDAPKPAISQPSITQPAIPQPVIPTAAEAPAPLNPQPLNPKPASPRMEPENPAEEPEILSGFDWLRKETASSKSGASEPSSPEPEAVTPAEPDILTAEIRRQEERERQENERREIERLENEKKEAEKREAALLARDSVSSATLSHPVSDLADYAVEPTETAAEALSEDNQVIGTYKSGGNTYVMFMDGSVEADTPTGNFRFQSLEELKEFIARGEDEPGDAVKPV